MDAKLFSTVLLVAFTSLILGPNQHCTAQTDVRNWLMDVRETMARKDKETPKEVVRVMQGRPAMWFSLVTKCHYVLKHNSGSSDHLQACEYLKEHDCQVTLEVARASGDFDNDKKIEKWIEMVKKLYQFGNDSIEDDPRSEEITLCLPRLNQVQKEASSSQSQKRSARQDQQTEFYRTSLFIIDNSHVDPSYAEKLEAIANIARKYEEKALSELVKLSGKKLKKLLPDVEKVCQNVEGKELVSADPEKAYQAAIAAGVTETIGICLKRGGAAVADLKENFRKYSERRIGMQVDKMMPTLFQINRFLPVIKQCCREWSAEKDVPALDMILQRKEPQEIIDDITKRCRDQLIREVSSAPQKNHQTIEGNEKTGKDSQGVKIITSELRYMCNIVKRHKEQNKI